MADVVVTGAGGWIGSAVAAELLRRGVGVTPIHRTTSPAIVEDCAAAAAVVVHAGAKASEARSDLVEGNIDQTVAVARGLSRGSGASIFLSSIKVYGWWDHDALETSAGSLRGHLTTFGNAKRVGELLLATAATRSYALRIANVYGPHCPAKYAFGTMLKSAVERGEIVLSCDGTSMRDFVHVDDVVNAIVRLVEHCLATSGDEHRPLNIVSGKRISLGRIAELVAKGVGSTTVVTRGGTPQHVWRMSNGAAVELGLMAAEQDPEQGIVRTMDQWVREPWFDYRREGSS